MVQEGKKTSLNASTFRIDLPDNLPRSGTTYLQAPQHTYEARQSRSLPGGHLPVPEHLSFPTNTARNINNTPGPSYAQPGISSTLFNNYSSETAPHIPHSYSNVPTSPIPNIIQAPYVDCSSPEPPAFATPLYSPLDSNQSPVNTMIAYPPEKVAQQLSPLQDIHPLERRNRYHVVEPTPPPSLSQGRNTYRGIDQQPPDEESTYRMMDPPTEDERRRSASREFRRREIERVGSSAGKSEEFEEVEVVPRIVRVETDGFGRVWKGRLGCPEHFRPGRSWFLGRSASQVRRFALLEFIPVWRVLLKVMQENIHARIPSHGFMWPRCRRNARLIFTSTEYK